MQLEFARRGSATSILSVAETMAQEDIFWKNYTHTPKNNSAPFNITLMKLMQKLERNIRNLGSHNIAKRLIKNMTEKDKITTESITYSYKDKKAVANLSFTLSEGKYLTILGASGSGKTTLLKLLGGYLKPSEGSIYLNSTNITSMNPGIRKIGMVFQNYALFPHLSAKKTYHFLLK